MPEDRFKVVLAESVIDLRTQLKWCLHEAFDREEYLLQGQ
jgi:hypothetical protein